MSPFLFSVIARRSEGPTRQSSLYLNHQLDCFAFARNDDLIPERV